MPDKFLNMNKYMFQFQLSSMEHKPDLEASAPICRCCLMTEKRMKDVSQYSSHFMDLAGINVSESDGLPQWVCWECAALLQKATRFKHKMLRAHSLLYEYLTRCAPFPIDAQDPELAKYGCPALAAAPTLVFDNDGKKTGFHKVLQHERRGRPAGGAGEWGGGRAGCAGAPARGEQPKEEIIKDELLSDYEDNINLEEYRLSRLTEEELAVTEEGLAELLEVSEQLLERGEQAEGGGGGRKARARRKKTRRAAGAAGPVKAEGAARPSVRRSVELDPTKIRVVTLNPEEQVRMREEESKASLKFPFQCQLCYKGFNFDSKLQNHMRKHSPSRGQFECKLCRMYLPTSYSYSVHALIHTQRYECVACGRRMQDRASILDHYRTQHEGQVTVFTCHICGKVSNNSKTHRGHMRNHHGGERPSCHQCGKSFVNKDSLVEHLQIHQGIKNYECGTCGKRFRTRTQIKHHQLKHSDTRDFYCVECDTRFKSAHSLRQHLVKSLKHKDKHSLKFPCMQCDKRYDTEARLQHHVSIQHEGLRPHRCAECGATLATASSLLKHRRAVHGGERPLPAHQCHACGKAFRGKSVLINHVRTHTGEKPFKCTECGRPFAQRAALRTHYKLVHARHKETSKPLIKTEQAIESLPAKSDMFPKEEAPLVFEAWRPPAACDMYFQVPPS